MKGKSRTTRRPAAKSVDDYFAGVPKPARSLLKELRGAIRSAVPAEATGTISYGIPCFKHNGALVWIAGFSEHRSLYPTPPAIEASKKELKSVHRSKVSIAILRIHRALFRM